ncbi:fluoride efflux transporter CrcB [Bacillaceae bacterium IKA-2]|nr:fluoride efflux transporter CrcB [Bacillaceae bacterium IKA-2]
MNWLLVGLGGAFGAMTRYAVGIFMMKKFPNPPIPIAMLLVNIVGSLSLGLILALYFEDGSYSTPLLLFLSVGFFGAFTTFSTFSVETMQLLRARKVKKAILYVFLTMILSVGFFIGGFWLVVNF